MVYPELNDILLKCMLLPKCFITIQDLTKLEKQFLANYYSDTYPEYYSQLINKLECLSNHDHVLNAECIKQVKQASEMYDINLVTMLIIQRIAEWEVYDYR